MGEIGIFSHVTLGTNDWARAKPFWDAVAKTLDWPLFDASDDGAAYGNPAGQIIFIGPAYDEKPASAGNGTHIAFIAKRRADVDAFYNAAMANGGKDEGKPGLRPHYHANYYGAYVRDPDGNKLQAVCHSSKG